MRERRSCIRHEDIDYGQAAKVLKAFRQGVTRGDLATRFSCSRNTIRALLEQALTDEEAAKNETVAAQA